MNTTIEIPYAHVIRGERHVFVHTKNGIEWYAISTHQTETRKRLACQNIAMKYQDMGFRIQIFN